jgi:hypothetical protein
MKAADLERAKQLLSDDSKSPFPAAANIIGNAMQADLHDVASCVVQLPQFESEEQQRRLLILAVQQGWASLVKHLLLNCGVQAPQNILSYVRDTATLEALIAGVPEGQHAEVAHRACSYGGLTSRLSKLLLQQYKEQWQQKQQLEQLKVSAQHILMAALTTQKQAEALLQEAQAAAEAAAEAAAAAASAAAAAAATTAATAHETVLAPVAAPPERHRLPA